MPGASPLGSCGSECEESISYKEIVWLGKITVGKVRGKLWGFREFLEKNRNYSYICEKNVKIIKSP